ncbi:MAG TPA: nucleotide disphospho-sugar-binding domain-containing protein [Alphaproteobacteria bacterium]|nr:nucleotide disphospho-sugar-binding domain-containing protein [Alphaproteobacteria bacterium]
MARILLGWELGAGLGHVTRLMAIARAVQARGHRPFLALRNLVEPWPAYRSENFPVLQAPRWEERSGSRRSFHAASIADIIAMNGFLDPADLMPMVQAWDRLIDAVRPAAIVADYSPTLCLAAHGKHPLVIVGDGFTAPPDDLPRFPILRPTSTPVAGEARILEAIRVVQKRRRRKPLEALPELFAARGRFVCTLPEIDPYRVYRSQPAMGAFQPLPPQAPPTAGRGFFAYLGVDARFIRTAVAGLASAPGPGRFYIRRAPRGLKRYLGERGHVVHETPVPLADALRETPIIVHHGGIGTTETALALGRPQIIMPRHLEQQLTAAALQELGVALVLGGNFTEAQVTEAVARMIDDKSLAQRARAFALELAAREQPDNVARIADACVEIARQGAALH